MKLSEQAQLDNKRNDTARQLFHQLYRDCDRAEKMKVDLHIFTREK